MNTFIAISRAMTLVAVYIKTDEYKLYLVTLLDKTNNLVNNPT